MGANDRELAKQRLWAHLFTHHRLNKAVLRGQSLTKLAQRHDGLHRGDYPQAIITHQHREG